MLKDKRYKIGVVGSTGAVGTVLLELLEERKFPLSELRLFASDQSAGTELTFAGSGLQVQALDAESFEGLDYCFFAAGGQVSREFIPHCTKSGCYAIDKSSHYRMHAEVPLVIPEVNPGDLRLAVQSKIIANPNCSTIQMVMALAPIQAQFGLRRVIVSTYQSTSGAGKRAMNELSEQVVDLFNQRDVKQSVFPHQIAFNCIPQIDKFDGTHGYTREELKMVEETRKILHDPELKITATAVRVPTFSCHSESVYLETEEPTSAEAIKELLSEAPGLAVIDDPNQSLYPLPFEAAGRDEVFVGRIRQDLGNEHGINLWIVADNLRKGAALNAVQVAEAMSMVAREN